MLCESLFALLLSSVLCSVTSLFILKSMLLQGSSMRKQTSPRSPFIPFTPIQQFVKFCLPTTFSFSWLASGSGLLWGFRSRVRGGSPGAGVWGVGWGIAQSSSCWEKELESAGREGRVSSLWGFCGS